MKGVDIVIEKQRLIFSGYLWTTFTCSWNGRCMRNYHSNLQIPEILVSGNNYSDVLLDDRKDALCFFDVLSERTENTANVDIYFAVNLLKLYPLVSERATEYALSDVVRWIRSGGLFTIKSIHDGYEAWSNWGMVKKEDNMQPFYLFKIKTSVEYVLNC